MMKTATAGLALLVTGFHLAATAQPARAGRPALGVTDLLQRAFADAGS